MDKKIERLLNRGVVDVNTKSSLTEKLLSGKKLRVKLGIDPTGSDLHLGHLVPLRKLAQFQEMGHHIILLFGTFTGKIGDPTGKDALRKPLTDADIEENMQSYLSQASSVLDVNKVEVVQNGDWLSQMRFDEVLELASSFTVSQMLQRDMFQKRINEEKDINMVEFFYPLMQGYDSVMVRADLEIGGTDQLFNLMAGRKIQEKFGQKPQDVLTVPLLEGTSGTQKMSKSLNNYIAIRDSARDVFGKTMSIPDHLIWKYLELLTDTPRVDITHWITDKHPKEAKISLARQLVTMLFDATEATKAHEEFDRMFSKKGLPDDMPRISIPVGEHKAIDVVIQSNLCYSHSDARRMIEQGAVKINNQKIPNIEHLVPVSTGIHVLQIGKRKFTEIHGEEKKEEKEREE